MDPQIPVVLEGLQNSVREPTGAQLEGRAILYQVLGNEFANGTLNFCKRGGMVLREGPVVAVDGGEAGDVHEAVPMCPGHVWFQMGDHGLRALDCGSGHIHRGFQGTEPVLVGGTHLDNCHIHWEDPAAECIGDLREG